MLSPNLHYLTCRALSQELERGPAAHESEYYMERYMLEPKRRNAHRTTANPEITHLRHTEMVTRALLRASLQHGCQGLDELAPVGRDKSAPLYDPQAAAHPGSEHFPSKGTPVDFASLDAAAFRAYVHAYLEPDSFWARYMRHEVDPEEHASPLDAGSDARLTQFRDCAFVGFKAASTATTDRMRRRQAATACVELADPVPGGDWEWRSCVAQCLWFGMLSTWNQDKQTHSHLERFAFVYRPVTQADVTMGSVKAWTAVLQQTDGPHSRQSVPLDQVLGPFIMLLPNPGNTHGHHETYRFFACPRKHGLL